MGRWKVTRRILLVAMAACLLCCTVGEADHKPKHNPGGGGGSDGGGGNGGGVIYFSYAGGVHTMNDDGSGVAELTDFPYGYGPWGDPSHELHAGKRWFLQDSATSLVALSDAGDVVTLALGAGVEVVAQPRWGNGDDFISFEGRWRDGGGTVIEGGLYEIEYTVDTNGNLTGSDGPAVLIFETPLFNDYYGLRPDMASHSWAPVGGFFVYTEASTGKKLLVGDVLTGESVTLFYDPEATSAHSPRYSPAGDKVMFQYNPAIGHSRVMLINFDGSGLKMLARGSVSWSKGVGVWSPTGSHLLYQHWDHFWEDSYILRAKSTGSGKSRLTDQSMGAGYSSPRALGWR